MELYDSHLHLDFPAYDGQREAIWREARDAGVTAALVPGYSEATWKRLDAMRAFDGVRVAVGVHPYALTRELSVDGLTERLVAAAERHGAVAIGECGLDGPDGKRRDLHAVQEPVLIAHLEAARETGLPLVVHVVGRHGRALDLLRPYSRGSRAVRGVIHAYSGSPELVDAYVQLGFRLGFGGAITRPHHRRARESLRRVPLDALLIETDAPDGTLFDADDGPGSGRPKDLLTVAGECAALREEAVSDVAAATARNTRALLGEHDAAASSRRR